MAISQIDASELKRIFLAGAANLDAQKELINELNVFPVPDGDTGTNMTMTIMSAAKEVTELEAPDLRTLCKAVSSGSLRGARGNSGVILSQLLRGLTREMRDHDIVDIPLMVAAMQRATETAYKAVMKPKEGTILTVARGISDRAREIAETSDGDFIAFTEEIVRYGNEVLDHTPELLPVLKQAGVVDSGGKGLMAFVEGLLMALKGEEPVPAAAASGAEKAEEPEEPSFSYCTELTIRPEKAVPGEELEKLRTSLSELGSLLFAEPDGKDITIHIHTDDPGLAIQRAISVGPVFNVRLLNLREEACAFTAPVPKAAPEARPEPAQEPAPRKQYGFITVAAGEGLSGIFRELGADRIIEGGQTMNPSTADILDAVGDVNADTIYVLPNNKNILLAAQQAAGLEKEKRLIVVPSTNIPEGVIAMVSFLPDVSPEENLETMKAEMDRIRTAEITYSIRNTSIDDFEIHEGDIMAIGDTGMLAVEKTVSDAVLAALHKMVKDDSDLVSLYYGADVTEEEAGAMQAACSEAFPEAEIELHSGGQPVYYYFISVE